MSLRVLVVDDEPPARAGVLYLCQRVAGVEVVGPATGGAEAVEKIRELAPDLVLLDVQMPEVDGFEVVRRVGPARMPPVVFFTAHDEFALRAFEAHALDYLLKPCSLERFQAALARATEEHRRRAWETKLAALVREQPATLAVKEGARTLYLEVTQLDWVEASDYYVTLHADGREHLYRESLRSLESRLESAGFVRIHRQVLVNAERVREVLQTPGKDAELVLRNGERLPVSRRRKAALMARLGHGR